MGILDIFKFQFDMENQKTNSSTINVKLSLLCRTQENSIQTTAFFFGYILALATKCKANTNQ